MLSSGDRFDGLPNDRVIRVKRDQYGCRVVRPVTTAKCLRLNVARGSPSPAAVWPIRAREFRGCDSAEVVTQAITCEIGEGPLAVGWRRPMERETSQAGLQHLLLGQITAASEKFHCNEPRQADGRSRDGSQPSRSWRVPRRTSIMTSLSSSMTCSTASLGALAQLACEGFAALDVCAIGPAPDEARLQ